MNDSLPASPVRRASASRARQALSRRGFLLGAAGALATTSLRAHAAPPGIVTVFAAASLADVLPRVADRWRTAERDLRFSFAASSTLARQIEQGARADLFVSADLDWMNYLAERNLLAHGLRRDVLTNRLVLVAPSKGAGVVPGANAWPTLPADYDIGSALGARGRLSVADPDYVPAGRYGRTALQSLGLWSRVADRLARAENVRAALAFVARGEAPLGIVYATDALAEKRVRVVGLFPDHSHAPIVYPFAVLARADRSLAVPAFDFLRGSDAAPIYRGAGFGIVGGAQS